MTGYVYRIERGRTTDGPGTRTTVVLKGCPLRCAWCDSPETLHRDPELIYKPDHCISCLACLGDCGAHAISDDHGQPVVDAHACRWCGDCADHCPTDARVQAGSVMTESRVLEQIEADRQVYAQSGGGVTFSGGEPLWQPDFLMRLLEACRERGVHTAVATSGYAPAEVVAAVADRADLLLFDLKHLDEAWHRKVTGMSNRLILENLARLATRHAAVHVRVPLVGGINDSADHIGRVAAWLSTRGLRQVDLLPYHPPVSSPYQSVDGGFTPREFAPPSQDRLADVVRQFESAGVSATIRTRQPLVPSP